MPFIIGAISAIIDRQETVVKSFSAKAWGLFEMHGNVWEWCEDVYIEDLSKHQNKSMMITALVSGWTEVVTPNQSGIIC